MITKLIALVIHEIVKAYRELDDSGDDDQHPLPEHIKLAVTGVVTDVLEKKKEEEESRHTPRIGFKSAGKDGNRGSTKGTED